MKKDIQSTLENHFGFSTLHSGQEQIIEQILTQQNSLAIFPTGSGKSLCYQLPALLLDGLSIVVSPLLSLMKDQVDALNRRKIRALQIDSSTEDCEIDALLSACDCGDYRLLYLSPERLENKPFLKKLSKLRIALFAIDEAHCFSEWGHSFRPDYLKLPNAIRTLKPKVVLAVTATATTQVERNIRKAFKIKKNHTLRLPSSRDNLIYKVTPCLPEEKFQKLLERLTQKENRPSIVYVTRQESSEHLVHQLSQNGVVSRAYNAGMNREARDKTLNQLLNNQCDVVVATIAFGMGVDKANIRSVIHYDLPKSPEGWLQESGRAGRDGQDSLCEVFACGNDAQTLETFIHASSISSSKLQRIIEFILNKEELFPVSLYDYSIQFDSQQASLKSILTDLEILGAIKREKSAYRRTNIRILTNQAQVLAGLSKRNQSVIRILLKAKGRLDLQTICEEQSLDLHTVCTLLEQLELSGDIALRPSNRIWFYKRAKHIDQEALTHTVTTLFQNRKKSALDRISQVVSILTSKRCITQNLSSYLGEKNNTPCGKCSSCLGETRKRKLPSAKIKGITKEEHEAVTKITREKRPGLRSEEQLIRFFAGSYSPIIFRRRLYQDDHFSLLKRLPYEDIQSEIRALLS